MKYEFIHQSVTAFVNDIYCQGKASAKWWEIQMEKQGNFVYIVKCRDGSYYTGWTTDVEKRVKEHNGGSKGAKYTRGRRPVSLVYTESFDTPNEAMSREWHIKHMTRQEKEQLINMADDYKEN
jgi:putative endonuclease